MMRKKRGSTCLGYLWQCHLQCTVTDGNDECGCDSDHAQQCLQDCEGCKDCATSNELPTKKNKCDQCGSCIVCYPYFRECSKNAGAKTNASPTEDSQAMEAELDGLLDEL